MTVADRMVGDVVAIQEGLSLREAMLIFRKHNLRHLPVLHEGALVGMVSDRDVLRATPTSITGADLETFNRVVDETTIGQIMTRNPYSVTPSMRLKDAVKVMHDRKFGALPVVEKGKLVGIITATDMLMDLHDRLPD
jgi:acetoin utilization protein AcuB